MGAGKPIPCTWTKKVMGDDMDNFTRGISNLTGPDPNRLFNGTKGGAPEKKGKMKGKKKDKKDKKQKVGICPSKEETVAFSNDVLKFIQKRLKPGAGVVIVAGLSPAGIPIIKLGIGRADNMTVGYEFESANSLVDMEARLNLARVVLDISKD